VISASGESGERNGGLEGAVDMVKISCILRMKNGKMCDHDATTEEKITIFFALLFFSAEHMYIQ
jgi:hypothetical protein